MYVYIYVKNVSLNRLHEISNTLMKIERTVY